MCIHIYDSFDYVYIYVYHRTVYISNILQVFSLHQPFFLVYPPQLNKHGTTSKDVKKDGEGHEFKISVAAGRRSENNNPLQRTKVQQQSSNEGCSRLPDRQFQCCG